MLQLDKKLIKAEKSSHHLRSLLIIGILVLCFSLTFIIRLQPLEYGFELAEFDPFFNYRATDFIVENGLPAYLEWHDDLSWHPYGRDVSSTSQVMLHTTAATLYQIFGMGSTLHDFVIWFPVVIGSLSTVVVFALVRTIGGTTAGLFASLFFAISPILIIRGSIGWFKSEPLGLFYGLLAVYLLLSGLKSDKWVFIEGCKNPRSVTVLIRGGSQRVVDEVDRSIHDALMVVKDVVEKPSIVAGGGSPEAYLSTELNEWAGSYDGREQLAMKQYAEALEAIPLTIAENAGMDPIDTIIALRANQSSGKQTMGINAKEGKIGNMFSLDIVEPLVVKEQIIKSATEAACMILRIDDVIAVSGGPGAGGGMPPMG